MSDHNDSLKSRLAPAPGTRVNINLRELSKQDFLAIMAPTGYDQLEQAYHALADRPLVTTGAGLLEDAVARLLRAFFVEDSVVDLLGDSGSARGKIGNPALRIDLAYGLGLISSAERDFLHGVCKLRNVFAHEHDVHFFEHDQRALAHVKKLNLLFAKGPAAGDASLKSALFVAMAATFEQLIERAASPEMKRREPFVHPQQRAAI